jgi:asparagine synthase (glutamine-hydrolysing)
MGVIFGRRNFDGRQPPEEYLNKVRSMLSPYGPDGDSSYSGQGISIIYCALHTTQESRQEIQPLVTASGTAVTWDGRLDNREELLRLLQLPDLHGCADVSIVGAAYERWGIACFGKLIGDWALSIWNPTDQTLILAKDPIGVRHLYFSLDRGQVAWSTVLEPLVRLANHKFSLDEEYIAGWFSFFPATRLTPYVGVESVPPSCFVRFHSGKQSTTQYWDFDPAKRIRYDTDAEYEDHFRIVFAESVRRRLRSDSTVLAELSGGMDSTCIVCMADSLLARGLAATHRVNTVSYYSDVEPNWNERPYFEKVEKQRGRSGCHIDVGSQSTFDSGFLSDRFPATPAFAAGPAQVHQEFVQCLTSSQSRVLLSGIGGDEVMGGVPTPTPELADLLVLGAFGAFCHQLKVWALNQRKPWFHLFLEVASGFLPPRIAGLSDHIRPALWLHPVFARKNVDALTGYPARLTFRRALPSFQENRFALNALQRQLACLGLASDPPFERAYPYLDRDLLEFLFSIPRNQLVRPGHRRSLMRRALAGIVPGEILNRKRKAFVTRKPFLLLKAESAKLTAMASGMLNSAMGFIDPQRFSEILQSACRGRDIPIVPLKRTLLIEDWLRALQPWGVLTANTYQHSTTSIHRARTNAGVPSDGSKNRDRVATVDA